MSVFKFYRTDKGVNNNLLDGFKYDAPSGCDLESCEDVVLEPLERVTVSLGVNFYIPKEYEIQIRPRSGITIKTGLLVTLGTIDADYRGTVSAIVFNLSNETQIIKRGDRIAQFVVMKKGFILGNDKFEECETFEEYEKHGGKTSRGSGGFGSTGV